MDARAVARLALPVAASQLGLMVMVLVDTYMVGKLGPEAIGGAGTGTAIFYGLTLFGSGSLMGLDYLASHAFGRGDTRACHYWLVQANYLALGLSVPLLAAIFLAIAWLPRLGLGPGVTAATGEFLSPLSWSLPLSLFFLAFRQYLAAMSSVRMTTAILLGANVVNWLLDWGLIFGKLGLPALGIAGAGWATTGTRAAMLVALVAYAYRRDARLGLGLRETSWRFSPSGLRELLRLGLPAGLQAVIRGAVFSVATPIVGWLGAVPLAAHTIVLNVASFTYMLPTGVSVAASVLVAQALGRGSRAEAGRAGWTAVALAALATLFVGLALYLFGGPIVGLFTTDAAVVEVGRRILFFAAAFQVIDAVQVVAMGALRGIGDTRTALYASVAGFWVVGLPVGTFLALRAGQGVLGMWGGLTVGLVILSALVTSAWRRALAPA